MNLRQKAKRFKKLYEESLPKKPYPIVYKNIPLKHYRIQQLIARNDIHSLQTDQQLMKTLIENRILQKLRPLISDNLIVEKDYYRDSYRCTLDIWMESENEQ